MAALLALVAAGRTRADTSTGIPLSSTLKPFTTAPAEPDRAGSGSSDPPDIFARVRGWIAYGNEDGIWAVHPTGQGHPIQLSHQSGEPLAWSSDGSKLLIWRPSGDLVVLNSGGIETRLVAGEGIHSYYPVFDGPASFSTDGSQVLYADGSGIYVVDSDGGTPRLLRSASKNWVDLFGVSNPAFSPDGTKIAYFEGAGDWGNGLRVMNADGSRVHVLVGHNGVISGGAEPGYRDLGWSSDRSHLAFQIILYDRNGRDPELRVWIIGAHGSGLIRVSSKPYRPSAYGLDWSPNASRLAFQGPGGIWTVSGDGSRLRRVTRGGATPSWSPDGSRIAYRDHGSLRVTNRNGTHVRTLADGLTRPHSVTGAITWNPLPLSTSSRT